MRKEVYKFTNSGDKMAIAALVDMLADARLMMRVGRETLEPNHPSLKKCTHAICALEYAINSLSAQLSERKKLSANTFADVE